MIRFLSKVTILLKNPFILIAFLAVLVSSCQVVRKNGHPAKLGVMYPFDKQLIKGGDFWITTFQKMKAPGAPIVFYIEGDGAAFRGKYRVSSNPTPKKATMITLAALDERPNIVYIGRPCQYTPHSLNPKCKNRNYWNHKRYSEEVIDSIDAVINKIAKDRRFHLVGYSGGGPIAVILASKNQEQVINIITVAGNLDTRAFTDHHRTNPLAGSLNALDFAEQVNDIPQYHLSGGKDKIVPPFIIDKYIEASNSSCVKQKIFPSNTHSKGWDKVWKFIINEELSCL